MKIKVKPEQHRLFWVKFLEIGKPYNFGLDVIYQQV